MKTWFIGLILMLSVPVLAEQDLCRRVEYSHICKDADHNVLRYKSIRVPLNESVIIPGMCVELTLPEAAPYRSMVKLTGSVTATYDQFDVFSEKASKLMFWMGKTGNVELKAPKKLNLKCGPIEISQPTSPQLTTPSQESTGVN